ncbi:MAG TPA: CRTAC1 family protein [Candidatus Cloacimonas sp.]|jgi:hypothetical protein|nr:CRTAC1 family protein [Candidatus Cloacimonadota bacterium]HNZ33440.1 CRTAC1 family protein [Candidatus Cloacimonas sp.]MDD3734583.1 CRTAC1 family protein [Candidatus Cloacimonadota bacterium]MDD4677466.1 CRTAC1 family protein [Candidatus Cloacimonadota bacterium]HQB50272.1 CRTAC1 family protein [Candidatus Cloacimonas sp.]
MKYLHLIILILFTVSIFAITNEEIRFLCDKEQFQLLAKHYDTIQKKIKTGDEEDLDTVLYYAHRAYLQDIAKQCHKRLAKDYHSLEDALQWLFLCESSEVDSLTLYNDIDSITQALTDPLDKNVWLYYTKNCSEEELFSQVAASEKYNTIIEAMAKDLIDEISIEQSDSLALLKLQEFDNRYPNSQYRSIALYYKLYNLANRKNWAGLIESLPPLENLDPPSAYISSLFLLSPTFRRDFTGTEDLLDLSDKYLAKAMSDKEQTLLYDLYSAEDWKARVLQQQVKLQYYRLVLPYGLYGDEVETPVLDKSNLKQQKELLALQNKVHFTNNNRGEQAEEHFWMAKVLLLTGKKTDKQKAANQLTQCLILGSPRNRYDVEAMAIIQNLHRDLKIKEEPLQWMQKIANYKGICFEDLSDKANLNKKGYTRVALADYNSDGLVDILFNGKYLYKNTGNMQFSEVTDSVGLTDLHSNGGIFADFNKDGLLDFVSYSHSSVGRGDQLMKNIDNTSFVNVNERAGDIDDTYPTEAVAWIDINKTGYPSLYAANYEIWQKRAGFPDFFWENKDSFFTDQSYNYGFREPYYSDKPGLPGRGVAPADFDNDGKQEIYVTNYRLSRNFCWKQNDDIFVDVAALYGLDGIYKNGYYGHSIGADWGDYDNDGDLDLFVANLAHPRYIDISDISMLLRNDGLTYRVVENDTIYFWQFTNVTEQAGITYDELHSDPLFFDADNDGYLDLFITSVYDNERSYLYHNKGDGTFEDITWLSGARVYNGWGNASADLNRDGLIDLVVGSGNGAKILQNKTVTNNNALYVKPVWKNDIVELVTDTNNYDKVPNTPAFGTRVEVTIKRPFHKQKTLIRELCSAKGTGSQNAPELHFGINKGKVVNIRIK